MRQFRRAAREPGFSTGRPCLHSGHSSGVQETASSVARATRGTPRSTRPPLRSMIEPTPKTWTPAARSSSITSRVLPPVVTTSSTTTAVSPGVRKNPRRRVILPGGVPFGEQEAGAHGPGDLVADDQAAQGGRNDNLSFWHTLRPTATPGARPNQDAGGPGRFADIRPSAGRWKGESGLLDRPRSHEMFAG